MKIEIALTAEDKATIRKSVVEGIVQELKQVNPASLRKHAYTVAEVAEQIGYHPKTVRIFIRDGRKDRTGKYRHLPKREITAGEYRILPDELDNWLKYF